ncbi:phage tail protein [uncultured Mitsuokella sp.]|uniref:gp53-like domain-containing protein n=1 Tax=uncultured Mitsuokella sp. TaxID=453120 RepID=UPI002607597A|nr:phage tail protein [uncultured Mitsuokella sp.]
MANWTGGQLTKAGRDLQIKVEAGAKLELTKIKLGDGTEGADGVDTLTDLVGAKAVFGISSIEAKDGMCTVTGVISSSNVTAGFYAREWGLFAKDPEKGEILYMIALDPTPDMIPPKTAALQQAATYAMNIVVSNAANIEARIDPAGLVNVEMLNRHNNDADAHANLLHNASFGQAIMEHLLSPKLAGIVDTLNADSLLSKMLAKALSVAGVQYSISNNGYIAFGVLFGGFIIQWGTSTVPISNFNIRKNQKMGEMEITFPIAFPNGALAVMNNATGVHTIETWVMNNASAIYIKAEGFTSQMTIPHDVVFIDNGKNDWGVNGVYIAIGN